MKQLRLPILVVFILKKLDESGFDGYVVGGAVRDGLMGKEKIFDWDMTTNAAPEETLQVLSESFYDNHYGTVMVAPKHVAKQMEKELGVELEPDQEERLQETFDVFDITTYRSESGYSDRRRPDKVEWGKSLEEDVKRRDFTVNALALKIINQKIITSEPGEESSLATGDLVATSVTVEVEIVDYFGGMEDLEKGVIRTVGDAGARFEEDALRMMRAIRIGAQLKFEIEGNTLAAIQEKAELITQISWERIRGELLKILASDFPADGVLLLHSAGLLQYILPELEAGIGVKQGGHHIYDVWKHAIESLRECPSKDPIVRLATLLHDIGKPATMREQGPRGVTFYGHEVVGARLVKEIADRLRLSKKQKERLYTLVRWHMFTYQPEMTDAAIRRFIKRVGVEQINDMMMLRVGDRKGGGSRATSWRLRELQQRIGENLYEPMAVRDLIIDGQTLMEDFGMKPGPEMGKLLNLMFEEVMAGKVENTAEALKARVREWLNRKAETEGGE